MDNNSRYVVVAANKAALRKLAESPGNKIKNAEDIKMFAAVEFTDRDAAIEYIDEKRKVWENKFIPCVTLRDVDSHKSPMLKELRDRVRKEEKAYLDAVKKADVRNFKAKLLTCSVCESKVNKGYIEDSLCPVCGTDLRTKSVVDSLNAKELKLKRARLSYRNEKSKTKYLKEAPLKYLVWLEESEG